MASQSRPFHMGGSNSGGHLNVDTTFTKIFVGGLAWETQRDTMSRYFQQFGDILEAVVITDKNTGRSKGYGFVTFKDQDSAMRACQNPSPVIDGRRANCNLASIGASNRTQYGILGRMRSQATSAASSISTAYIPQPTNYAFPYYGYSGGYPQETMYPLSYYGGGSGQQHYQHHFSPYYPANHGVYPNYYPYYVQYSHSAQALHYPPMLQYPYSPQQFGSGFPVLSAPASVSAPTTGAIASGPVVVSSPSQPDSGTA